MKLTEHGFMEKALAEALKGGKRVRPNPFVGAVVVKNGRIIGTGYHQCCGGHHAEINALKDAGKRSPGADLYVTLEPCDHYGKTPPCTGAIIAAGIKNLYISMQDPNPAVNGKGIKKLIKAGITVHVGLLSDKSREINKVYIKNITKKEPYVILKMAESLDGKIATHTGESKWISCDLSRRLVHQWRAESDGVMIGMNTALKDKPMLTSHGIGDDPVKIIISSKKYISSLKRFDNKHNLIVITEDTLHNKTKNNTHRINLKHIIKYLYNKSIYQLLIEGGGTLSAHALEDGIVDEVRFFIAPKIIGGSSTLTSVEGKGVSRIAHAISIKKWSWEAVGKDMLVKGYINEKLRSGECLQG